MPNPLALLTALLLLASAPVAACSIQSRPPQEIVAGGDNVVLAYPLDVSLLPRIAQDPEYLGSFRETVLWKVVVSYKGGYQPGDQFTTRHRVTRAIMCSPGAGLYDKRPLLLVFSGREPYAEFGQYHLDVDPELFQYLQKTRVSKAR